MTIDEFECHAMQAAAAGYEIKLECRRNDWWCSVKHPTSWRYFGCAADTAQQALLDALAKADLARMEIVCHDGVRL